MSKTLPRALLTLPRCVAIASAQTGWLGSENVTLIKVGRLLDVRTGKYASDQGMLIEKDRIGEIGPLPGVQARIPKNGRLFDLAWATVLHRSDEIKSR